METTNYRTFLTDELSHRKTRNPRYSLRAFARDLKVDPSFLSRLLSGKADPSVNLSVKIVQRLNLSDVEKRRFIASIVDDRQRAITKAFGEALA